MKQHSRIRRAVIGGALSLMLAALALPTFAADPVVIKFSHVVADDTPKGEIHTPTAEERAALKKALVPVHRKMESRVGAGVIQAIYKETGFDPAGL